MSRAFAELRLGPSLPCYVQFSTLLIPCQKHWIATLIETPDEIRDVFEVPMIDCSGEVWIQVIISGRIGRHESGGDNHRICPCALLPKIISNGTRLRTSGGALDALLQQEISDFDGTLKIQLRQNSTQVRDDLL